ncbi:hypothetical protein ACFS6H_11680 [Terrimonas rubra]|uniref:Uncharacterized protein n=1 Tax=Terrimonas rubra TaxID=1035890 RepID=A0ABW6A7Y8_9BACT
MSSVYAKQVLQEYKTKRASSALSPALVHPTPAKLRDECLLVFKERFKRKDEHILRFFFGPTDDITQYPKLIDKCDIDRFRPLVNILRNPERKTDDINIELLAWLINFEPRPFDVFNSPLSKDFTNTETNPSNEEQPDKIPPKEKEGGKVPPIPPEPEHTVYSSPKKHSLKKIGIYTSILIFVITGIYIIYNSNKSTSDTPMVMGKTLNGPEACMYWTGDHYEQVSCQDKKDGLVIALDSFKLQHFRKITRPDTITQNHVGRVWYIKNGGDIEFYTADGMHPVEIKKRLKPATAYIIDKYILSRTN